MDMLEKGTGHLRHVRLTAPGNAATCSHGTGQDKQESVCMLRQESQLCLANREKNAESPH